MIQTSLASFDVITVMSGDVTISGFTIQGSTSKRGVYLYQNSDLTLENCIITGNYNGFLRVEDGSQRGRAGEPGLLNITGCTFEGNTNVGVVVDGPGETYISNSIFRNMEYGLALQNTMDAGVIYCSFEGMKTAGIFIIGGSDHVLIDCDFTGDVNSETGILVQESDDHEIRQSTFTGLDIGIEIRDSVDNSVIENEFTQIREYGLRLENTRDNSLHLNEIESGGTGVLLQDSDENTLSALTISGTGTSGLVGLDLMGSKDNSLENIEVSGLSSPGYSVIGIRLAGGSNGNSLMNSKVSELESSRSWGLLLGSSLNEIRNLTVTDITSHGQLSSTGIFFLPHANGNLLVQVAVFGVEGPVNSTGFYLDTNSHNNLSKCQSRDVSADQGEGVGLKFNNTGPAYLNDSFVRDNGIGVLCENGSALGAHWNSIEGNTVYGVWNKDSAVTVNAENNYWGVDSGPSGEGPGTGDKVSQYVDFDPWTGIPTGGGRRENKLQPGTGTVDEKGTADTVVDYDTGVPVTVSTLKYDSNPGGAFSGDLGKYIDVHLNASEGVNELTVKLYYTAAELGGKDETKLKMYWHDGAEWKECSETGVATDDTGNYAGYIWAKVRTDTSPSLTEMIGTPFGAAQIEEGGDHEGDDDDDDDGSGMLVVVGIIVVLVVVVALLAFTGVLPLDMFQTGKEEEAPKSLSEDTSKIEPSSEESTPEQPAPESAVESLKGE